MEGDADDRHYINGRFDTVEELVGAVESLKDFDNVDWNCDILEDCSNYCNYFGEDWFYNEGIPDSFDGFAVTYFDKDGIEYEVFDGMVNLSSSVEYRRPKSV